MNPYKYPTTPLNIPSSITTPSSAFRFNVIKVTATIILFVVSYLLMLAVAIILAWTLVYLAYMLISTAHHLMAILFAIAMVGAGGLVCFFLIKFLFSFKKENNDGKIEVTEEEYPELFDFIRKVSEETQTKFPAHIYLSPEVNASVSYDSSFKSLFFPVRKNLTIGLGLVNMINMSEFKAILAHEFGHFSQKSMATGSYVYQVNQVIYNLLYENNQLVDVMNRWAEAHYVFALGIMFASNIMRAIQWMLRKVYTIVNKSYMGLSRQMEFNADAISASVSGSNNGISALRRSELASSCYDGVIDKYNEWLADGWKGLNVYTHQRIVASCFAADLNLPVSEGLPVLDNTENIFAVMGKVNVDDQWASHPTRAQRENALTKLSVAAETVEDTAWVVFGSDIVALQQKLTTELYKNARFKTPVKSLDDETFEKMFVEEYTKYDFPAFYNGYYDSRPISEIDVQAQPAPIADISSFMLEHKSLLKRIQGCTRDINLLTFIGTKSSGYKSFDFDGRRYKKREAESVSADLENEKKLLEAKMVENDTKMYAHFRYHAANRGDAEEREYVGYYTQYFSLLPLTADYINHANSMLELYNEITSRDFTIADATKISSDLTARLQEYKDKLAMLDDKLRGYVFQGMEMHPSVSTLLNSNYRFFNGKKFLDKELHDFHAAMSEVVGWLYHLGFFAQRDVLNRQLEYIAAVKSV